MRYRRWLWYFLSTVLVIGLNAGSASARATEDRVSPGLTEVTTSSGDDAGTTSTAGTMSTPANDNFVCDYYPWVFVAASPGGYVIGNCAPGWHLHRTIKSDPVAPEGTYFDGGYIFGNFNGCGWVRADRDRQVGTGSYTACQSPSRNAYEFGSLFNCPPGWCSDGTYTTGSGCQLYANYRPWSATPAPTDPIGGVQSGAFYWRYVTLDGQYVMVRDPDIAAGYGNWAFVRRSCLASLPAGPGGTWNGR